MTDPREPSPPRFLYKYLSLDNGERFQWARDCVERGLLFWPSPDQFNDPYDCVPVAIAGRNKDEKREYFVRVGERAFRRLPARERATRIEQILRAPVAEIAEGIRQGNNRTREKLGICSLSEHAGSLLMWAHYADKHRGICLEFRSDEFNAKPWLPYIVKYGEDRPFLNLAKLERREEMFDGFRSKGSEWEYEAEWRMFDHFTGPGVHQIPDGALAAVILGPLIADDKALAVREWAATARVTVRAARLHSRKYKVVDD